MYHPRSFCSGAPHLFFILSGLHLTFLPSALLPAGPQAAGERPGLTTGGAGAQNKRYKAAFSLFAFSLLCRAPSRARGEALRGGVRPGTGSQNSNQIASPGPAALLFLFYSNHSAPLILA